SAVELLIANDKIKLIELNKKLDREIISFGYLKQSIEIIAYILSLLSIIPRSYVLSSLEADLQEIQQKLSHRIDFDTFFKVAQNFKSK
ncbi:unnamed protein product, partial [Rotaria sordida]